MPSCRALIKKGTEALRQAGIPRPDFEARLLAQEAFGLTHSDIISNPDNPISKLLSDVYNDYLNQRINKKPFARIVGAREFWGIPFALNAATLEPRPDSETVVEMALACWNKGGENRCVADLGTGTGCLLISFLKETDFELGIGVDIDAAALQCASDNARTQAESRFRAVQGNWLDPFAPESLDFVLCNPPYLRYEERADLQREVRDFDPEKALFSGADGLEAYRRIASALPSVLKPGGRAVFEVGAGQAEAVLQIFAAQGLPGLGQRKDLGGHIRAVAVQKAGDKFCGRAISP